MKDETPDQLAARIKRWDAAHRKEPVTWPCPRCRRVVTITDSELVECDCWMFSAGSVNVPFRIHKSKG